MNSMRCLPFTVIAIALAGCSQSALSGSGQASQNPLPQNGIPQSGSVQNQPPRNEALVRSASRPLALTGGPSSKISHVVVIMQENRSTNDLFNAFPGADTVRIVQRSHGRPMHLLPVLLTAPYDIDHSHLAFELEYAGNWSGVATKCKKGAICPPPAARPFGFVPRSEVEPYYVMARRYAFANKMFQTNEGPSFPAHQYILSGTSSISNGSPLLAAENPLTPRSKLTGGCDSPPGSQVVVINPDGQEDMKVYPCFNRNSLIQLIDTRSLTWSYYQSGTGAGLWHGPDAISPVRYSREFSTDVISPPARVLTDISKGDLANVVWVTPTAAASDHAGVTNGSGPSWVASVVNAIGESKYWDTTAIFVTWDDWGGWYDPVLPPERNSYELGFRVPLIVISPYAKQHYISEKQHEFGSILKFTEEVFGLPSLGTTDSISDDLSDCFNFFGPPSKFRPIPAPLPPNYFLRQPISNEPPDDDF
jgi:phospholipase C